MLRRALGRPVLSVLQQCRVPPAAALTQRLAAGGALHGVPSTRALSTDVPSFEVVTMPALSPTMETGTIVEWTVQLGEEVSAGSLLCEVETDKATVGFEFQDDAVIAKYLVEAGAEIAVGTPVAITVDDDDSFAAFQSADAAGLIVVDAAAAPPSAAPEAPPAPAPSAPEPTAAAAPTPAAPVPVPTAPAAPGPSGGRVFASPLARKLAREQGFDISHIPATGPNGRVVAADVEDFTPAAAPAAAGDAAPAAAASGVVAAEPTMGDGFVDYPVSEASREIAARLTKSKQEVPHYYLTVDVELGALLDTRKSLNAVLGEEEQITVNDMLLKAAGLAMKTVPDVNSSWMETVVRAYSRCDVNVVVGVGNGLVAPVIQDIGSKGIKSISDEVRAAVEGAQAGSLNADAYKCGTFTVVNLGMYGVKSAAPIVTMPQAAVLALGSIEERVLPNDDPESDQIYRLADVVTATCSFDHRVVDGAVGAQWLAAFKKLVENPMTMLL